jgi:hypothetical protein
LDLATGDPESIEFNTIVYLVYIIAYFIGNIDRNFGAFSDNNSGITGKGGFIAQLCFGDGS